jgi:hypothetical protein
MRQAIAPLHHMAKAVLQQGLQAERRDPATLCGGVDFPRNPDAIRETLDHDVCVGMEQRQFVGQ